jgi:polyisoprenoid-binding protein YceI
MATQTFEITSTQSNIDWVGRKVTGAHNGTISIKEGKLILSAGQLIGGRIVIDTTTIRILDVTDPVTNAQFAGHLASEDFFSIQKYPEATLEISSVSGNRVQGDLTIKGIIHAIDFEVAISVDGGVLTATGKLVIDRTRYGMRFRSGNFFTNLGDNLIYNDFELDVLITAKTV